MVQGWFATDQKCKLTYSAAVSHAIRIVELSLSDADGAPVGEVNCAKVGLALIDEMEVSESAIITYSV